VAAALRTLQTRQAEAKLWSERIVPSAEANVELVRQGWLGGKLDLFRVVQVAREAADARRRELEVIGDLWRARIELDRATGNAS
jgi:outer membrane protein TolC